MAQLEMPRRPAMLDAVRAGAIIGDKDPAASTAVAHTAARTLMGVGGETFTDADVAHLCETVCTNGVDTIVHIWSRGPKFTLPGTLWRIYLLHEWYHRDLLLVAERYAEGSRALIIQGFEAPVELRLLSLIMEEAGSLLHGDPTDNDLGYMLNEASRAMRVLATGKVGILQIEDPADPLTHHIIMCYSVLLVAADGLDVVTREAAVGTLGWPRIRYVVADLGVPWAASWKARTGVAWRAHQGTSARGRLPLSLCV